MLRDQAVSRFHLRLRAATHGVKVEDVGSTNGSWVGGARFRELDVERSTEIELGASLIRVELEAEQQLETSHRDRFGTLRGRSVAMQRVFRELGFSARSKELSVLLLGETGTGKELAARAIHEEGPRSRAPFVVVDCAGLSPSLIESQLFGHVKGAFTDARVSQPGPFELAEGGTVFLDEIGELPMAQQAKLLRVLQERSVQRVGASKAVKVDVKILAATRRDLLGEVNAERFREDLYFRIAGEEVMMPPLRERREDIPFLVSVLAAEICKREEQLDRTEVPPDVVEVLCNRAWPGNVRELQHAIHRYLVRGELGAPRTVGRITAAASRLAVDDLLAMPYADAVREFESRLVTHAIEDEGHNHSRAAQRLKIDRSTLYRVLGRKPI